MYKTAQIFKRTAATLMVMSLALTLFVANIASVKADVAAIDSFEVVQSSFNPSEQSAEINFSLNTSGKVGLEIHEGSNPIKTLAMRQDVTAGSHTYYWDGTNDSGTQVAEGTYKAQLLFYGSDFALFADDTVTVDFGGGTTPQPTNVITNDYAYPQQFDPRLETTKIYFTLNDSVEELAVEIEKNGSHVVTLMSNQSKSSGTYYVIWNGRNKHNVTVGEGEYRYVISATGDFGSDVEYGYIASNYGSEIGIEPNVTNDYVSPSTFDPQDEDTRVFYTLNTGADVTVEIYDGSMLVDILSDHEDENSGTHSVIWDGRNLNGDLMSEDTYTYKVYAENAWGDDMEEGSVTVDYESNNNTVVTPDVTNTYASPDEFDPTEEDTTITYTLNTCAYITAKVYKKSNNAYVTTLEEIDYQCEGNHSLTWDGRDDDHDIVENGQYTIEISAQNSKGSDEEDDEVTVDDPDADDDTGDAPNVYDMEVDPEEFDPYDTTTTLSFRLDECADTTVRVYDEDDDLVNELRDEVYWCSGEHDVVWDGEDEDNDEVEEGDYYFKVIAENEDGDDTEEIWVEVDYDADDDADEDPKITDVDVDPEEFDPYEEEAELSFELNTCAEVTIEVRDDDNDLVYEVIDDKWLCEGDHDYDWDGEDEDNDYVRQDDYEFYIRAENSYGTDTERADVEVDYNGHTVDEEERCAGYLDVSANDPYCEAIEYVKGSGIFDGYPDGYFRPYQAINRAETTKVIVRAFNYPELPADGTNLGFWDLSPWDWYMGYIRTAKQYGIIQGYPDGSFKPAQTVNRVELLKIFLESAKVALPSCAGPSYPDTMANVWYSDYVCYAKMHNLMDTDYYGMFNPAKPMTRGDVAELFYRYSERNLGDNNYYDDDYYNDYDSPRVSNVRLSDYVVEEGDGFRVYYTLDEGAEVTIEILDDNKDEIRTLLDELYRSSGEHSVYFDGEDDDEDELSEDEYFVRIEAENRNGRYKVDIKFEVDEDAGGVRITSLELSDDEFDPDYEDVEISFRITEDAEVTVRVYDDDDDFVAELWDDRDRDEGNHDLEWDGRDDDDDQVSDGNYTIKVIADDGDDTDTDEIEVEVNS
ncbi:hypothetical protein GF369_01750 [Candidatus Peregrinibacteria bacterium]|nr:hypothetical protein [Candidatus Peregrinibacteria bacterium]